MDPVKRLCNLLSRFYDVQEGAIEIDGIDIRQLSMQQLRQHLELCFKSHSYFEERYGKTYLTEGLQRRLKKVFRPPRRGSS